jgi:hypothetical protein
MRRPHLKGQIQAHSSIVDEGAEAAAVVGAHTIGDPLNVAQAGHVQLHHLRRARPPLQLLQRLLLSRV